MTDQITPQKLAHNLTVALGIPGNAWAQAVGPNDPDRPVISLKFTVQGLNKHVIESLASQVFKKEPVTLVVDFGGDATTRYEGVALKGVGTHPLNTDPVTWSTAINMNIGSRDPVVLAAYATLARMDHVVGVTIEAMQFSYLAPGDAIEEWATFTGEAMAAPGAGNTHVKAILKANG